MPLERLRAKDIIPTHLAVLSTRHVDSLIIAAAAAAAAHHIHVIPQHEHPNLRSSGYASYSKALSRASSHSNDSTTAAAVTDRSMCEDDIG
jgi:uncharacterized protein (DUF849 family)